MEKPYEQLLDRAMARVIARPVIDVASPLLQRIVNHATMAFRRCENAASGEKNEDLAPLILYRHAIELTDGMEAMIAESCSVPLVPLLRSCWEATLSLRYIVEDDQLYARRSLSWTHAYLRRRVTKAALFDQDDQRGTEFLTAYSEEIGPPPDLPQGAEEEHRRLREFIDSEAFTEIQTEFERHRREKGRVPNWFTMFGGPANRFELAEALGMSVEYRWLFAQWSAVTHAGTADLYVSGGEDRQAYWSQLRNPEALLEYSFYAVLFLLRCTRLMIDQFRSGEDLSRWFLEHVAEDCQGTATSTRLGDGNFYDPREVVG